MSDSARNRSIAEAFSRHRFTEVYPHLSADAAWISRGQSRVDGRDAVIAACEESAAELGQLTTHFLGFRSLGDGDLVAVETVGRYVEPDGAASFVASVDLYDFVDGQLVRIVSYAVEIDDPTPR